MLTLLIKTRLRYYRNYFRYHFDRTARIEIAIIILILLYLTGRSPADIGYSLTFVQEPNFPQLFRSAWLGLLPFFYLTAEALALMTLRPSSEWQMLGSLPFPKKAIAQYHLLRHTGKTLGLLLLGTLPFFMGDFQLLAKVLHFLSALAILHILQLAGFQQAFVLRTTTRNFGARILRWIPAEAVILSLTLASPLVLQRMFAGEVMFALTCTALAWGALTVLLFALYRIYQPGMTDVAPAKPAASRISLLPAMESTGIINALLIRDVHLLWRRQRSTFYLLFFSIAVAAIPSLTQTKAEEVYASTITLQMVFGWLLINSMLTLFEYDGEKPGLIKLLPIRTVSLWWSRWRLVVISIVLPVVIPALIAPIQHSLEFGFLLFVFFAFVILPAVFATMYCNAGFGMFPNVKYSGLILNISLLLVLLFWFFMPFGSPMLLVVMLMWIRKSQRHFQSLEIA
jgi:hypothetical protein